jgi:hypothetical protein
MCVSYQTFTISPALSPLKTTISYYRGALVIAESVAEALTYHPDRRSTYQDGMWGETIAGKWHQVAFHNHTWPNDLSKIQVELVGYPLPSLPKGVLLSF